jgi:hypothetical protein
LSVVRWFIACVTCLVFTWGLISIGIDHPDMLPLLVSLIAGGFLLEYLLILRAERKARESARAGDAPRPASRPQGNGAG